MVTGLAMKRSSSEARSALGKLVISAKSAPLRTHSAICRARKPPPTASSISAAVMDKSCGLFIALHSGDEKALAPV